MRYHGTIAVLLIYRQEYSYKGKVFIIVYLCTKRYHGKAEGLKNELEDQFPQIKYLVSKNLSQNGEFVSQWEISKHHQSVFCNFLLDGFLAVGSYNPENVNAEKFDFETGSWTTADDYPYSDGVAFSYYDMLFIPEMAAYIVIGGVDDDIYAISTIGMFRNDDWSPAGQLNTARAVNF